MSQLPSSRHLRSVTAVGKAAQKRPDFPVFTSLRGYRAGWLRGDAVAGLTVWAVLVPEALAYASIAGVSPVVGLYTALTATLALTTGVLALAAGLVRLGFVANFISEPVLKGFIVGLALTIIVGQVPKLLGISKGSGDFFEQLWHLLTQLGRAQGPTVAVGLGSLAIVLVLRRLAPVVPAPLVAVLAGILGVHAFSLRKHGVEIVGHISGGLPSFGLPHVPAADYLKLTGPAVGVMLVGFAEGLGAAKTYAARNGYQISPNRELIGLGAANLGAEHHPEDQTTPRVRVLRVESGVFFANADHVRAAIEDAAADGTQAVVLDCETMPFIDVSAARILGDLAADLGKRGVRLVLAGEIGQVRDMLAAVTGHGLEYHRSVPEAVTAAQAQPVGQPTREG